MLERFAPIAVLNDCTTVHRLDVPLPVPADVGAWLIEHRLFAAGKDFTNPWVQHDPSYEGTSTLKKLWEGLPPETEAPEALRVWVLATEGRPTGVVVWRRRLQEADLDWANEVPGHPSHHPKRRLPVAFLGHAMAYQIAAARGQGHVKAVVEGFLAPEVLAHAERVQALGAIPLLVANDAMKRILSDRTSVPLVEDGKVGHKVRVDVWSMHTRSRMYPEDPRPQDAWFVAPEPCPKPSPRRRMA